MADLADDVVRAIERFVEAKIHESNQPDATRRDQKQLDAARAELAMAINNALRSPNKGERETIR